MAEAIEFTHSAEREIIYKEIEPQIASLIEGETDVIANLANVAAVLRQAFGFFWVGFYFSKEGQLVLGPFQGPIACTRIDFDKGVCGHAFTTRRPVIVPNVDEFPGHIVCATESKSEVVIPVFNGDGSVFAVLDVDSDKFDDFSETDAIGLGRIVRLIEKTHSAGSIS